MQIKKVKLTNFENHQDSTLDLTKVNVIIGKNGNGKSAIVNGVSLGLSGTLPTKPYNEYIQVGQHEAAVELEVAVNGATKNTRKKISEDGKVKTDIMSTAALLAQVGTNAETARTLIDTWYFVDDADDKVRRSVLSNVLVPTLTCEEITNAISGHASQSLLDNHAQFIRDNFASLESAKKTQMEVLYKKAYDARRDVKKEGETVLLKLNEAKAKLAAYKTSDIEIDKEMVERTTKHAELTKSLEYENKTQTAYIKDIDSYKTKIGELEDTGKDIKSQLGAEVTKEQVDAISSKISVLQSQIRGIEASIKSLSDVNGADSIRCPYFESCKYDKIKDDLQAAIARMVIDRDGKTVEVTDLQKTYNDEKSQNELYAKYKEIESMFTMATTKLTGMQNQAAAKEKEITDIKTAIKELEDQGIATSDGLDALSNQKEVALITAQIATHEADIAKLKNSIQFYEEAVTVYSNKDIWASLLSHNKETFITKLTESISLLIPKYTPIVNDDMDISFNGVNINTLSKSEKFRVGVGIQTALAISSGIGVVVADGSDIITDPTEFIELINKLGTMDEIDTLIVASSIDFTDPKQSRAKNKIEVTASLFHVVDGIVTKQPDIHGDASWDM